MSSASALPWSYTTTIRPASSAGAPLTAGHVPRRLSKKANEGMWRGSNASEWMQRVISPDFSLVSTGFFLGKHLIHFLVLKMKDFRNFVLHNHCILVFDAEQVYSKLQVINLKNKEATVNPKPQTLKNNWFFENPIP